MAQQNLDAAAQRVCAAMGCEFVGALGQGAFKSAFLVTANGQRFALKIAPIQGSIERLVREFQALSGCSHDNIAKIHAAFPFEDSTLKIWVVLEECLGGGTLEAIRPAGNSLAPGFVKYIGLSLADVLKHLNEKRLVHRDIKPANILFRDQSHEPVLTDFGVVRILDQPSLTRDYVGMGPGTPAYAAPEQLNNEKALIDWRTDQFGLAIVLAEAVLGRHPFLSANQNIGEAVAGVAARSHLTKETCDALTALGFSALTRALEPWPINRFRKPSDFIDALKE